MEFKYFAFISYNSKDITWGKRLQKKLEGYKLPSTLCSERGWNRRPMKPVFFAPTDIQPGELTEELKERLCASQNLIVICSPNSAKSDWVGKEIEFFHSLGRTKSIHFFIVAGIPHSGNPNTECFNKVVDKLGLPDILGANINERTQTYPYTDISWHWLDTERAYVQLISKLLHVEFDTIWQRHKRQLKEKIAAWVISLIAVLCIIFFVWKNSQPVDVSLQLQETSFPNNSLPPLKDAIVTLSLENEKKIDTIKTLGDIASFKNIPHKFIGKKTRIQFECLFYQPIDTALVLKRNVNIAIQRDPNIFGNIHFKLRDRNKHFPNIKLSIAGYEIRSDNDGYVNLFIPLHKQNKFYIVKSSLSLENDTLFMPCDPNASLVVK